MIHLFGSVEDMEGRLLESTVPFEWESVGQYLDYLGRGLGPNVGMFVGHSVLRLYVMGEAAQQRAATDAEIAQMAEVLRSALRAGAFGLSYSYGHLDEQGNELPCHFADRREMMLLALGTGSGLRRPLLAARAVAGNVRHGRELLTSVCEAGRLLADRLTLGPVVADAIGQQFERWDGRGAPQGLAGDAIHLAARVSEVATQAVVFHRATGPDAAMAMLRDRSGGWFDPSVAAALRLCAREDMAGKLVVAMICDSAERYVSTPRPRETGGRR